jgi:hypothetical protein
MVLVLGLWLRNTQLFIVVLRFIESAVVVRVDWHLVVVLVVISGTLVVVIGVEGGKQIIWMESFLILLWRLLKNLIKFLFIFLLTILFDLGLGFFLLLLG